MLELETIRPQPIVAWKRILSQSINLLDLIVFIAVILIINASSLKIIRNGTTQVTIRNFQCAVYTRTNRYKRSSIPIMTRLLSWHPPLKYAVGMY